jgi:AAA+ superfamily predicted ATPase
VPELAAPPGAEGILRLHLLPDPAFVARWERILVGGDLKARLLNYALFALTARDGLDPVRLPVHGLALLAGPPGTGKTTLAGGLADRVARELGGQEVLLVEIDPHRFPSQLLGETQRAVARLFQRTLPDLAARGKPTVVLLDEVETLAVSRERASLETNPVDVHRATEALLAGIDTAARYRNLLFVATTNFPEGLDRALLSRADLVEEMGPPPTEVAIEILRDTLDSVGAGGGQPLERVVTLAADMDARSLRKLVLQAIVSRRQLALEPSGVRVADLEAVLRGDGAARPARRDG